MAVSPISWQRNLNRCGSPRSSSESRRPLDVISVCTRPGQHVTDRIGPYQPQVPGGVRVRSEMDGPRAPRGGVTRKRRCTYRPPVIYLILNKLLSLSRARSLSRAVSRSVFTSPPTPFPLLSLQSCASDAPWLDRRRPRSRYRVDKSIIENKQILLEKEYMSSSPPLPPSLYSSGGARVTRRGVEGS